MTVNIAIMRAFVELRRAATSYTAIERRLTDLARETVERLGKQDEQLLEIFRAYGNSSRHRRGRSAASASVYLRKTSSRPAPLLAAGLRALQQSAQMG